MTNASKGNTMNLPRRRFLHLAAGTAVLPSMAQMASAQSYPTRTIRWIVPMAPGDVPDILARLIGQWLSERLGHPVVFDNRPGAATNIGTEAAVRAAPDGYSLLGPPAAINATLYDKLNFNVIRDIAPVASIARAPNVMEVSLSVPVKTVPEFIAYAKAKAGVDLVHVPYRGSVAAITDMLSGQVHTSRAVICGRSP
jgi:tripartite-type tricarboxylate transporter receptor subunit TctC